MKQRPGVASRMMIGAIAGFVATGAMTAAMNRIYRHLPRKERYPLPPRELIDSAEEGLGLPLGNETSIDATLAGHFGYGAAAGSLIGAANVGMSPISGALAGVAVWMASYLGWIPAVGLLKPATRHPPRRDLLMLGAHLVWGAATALHMRELMRARTTILAAGEDRDAAPVNQSGD